MPSSANSSRGRPIDPQVSNSLLVSTLQELATNGYEKTTIENIARLSSTSKQAIYRRWPDKPHLVADALRLALARIPSAPPQRGNVALDLKVFLSSLVAALQDTPLGSALHAVVSLTTIAPVQAVLREMEETQQLLLRQIFIATPFEAEMDSRIDLLIGLVSLKSIIRGERLGEADLDTAIQLVLGLTAPRDPRSSVPKP